MQRIMIVGQPGSGKSTLARMMGGRTGLPVVHIDRIHWMPGWVERPRDEKTRLCHEVEAQDAWIFEGGHSVTWPNRVARADMLIWLDVPLWLRMWRVTRRSVLGLGHTRPDMSDGCEERLGNLWGFYRFIWRTRHSARQGMRHLFDAATIPAFRLGKRREISRFLDLEIPRHRIYIGA